MNPVSIAELKNVHALNELPDEHLQWILDRTEYRVYKDEDVIVKFGEPADNMWIIINGKATFYMNVNGIQVYYYTFENDSTVGGVSGLMPYSRMKTNPVFLYAVGDLQVLTLHKKYFSELEQLNPDLIQKLIGYMTERARTFAVTKLQHEKVNALGNLAAGIARELNNPASAIDRISNELEKRLTQNYSLTEKLLNSNTNPEHIKNIQKLVGQKSNVNRSKIKLSTRQKLEMQDEMQDEMEDWMEKNGIHFCQAVETFSEFGFTLAELSALSQITGKEFLADLIPWLENLISSQILIKDLGDASTRISKLVSAIKSHVHMDRTNE